VADTKVWHVITCVITNLITLKAAKEFSRLRNTSWVQLWKYGIVENNDSENNTLSNKRSLNTNITEWPQLLLILHKYVKTECAFSHEGPRSAHSFKIHFLY
jgi:hypothetical protein